MTYFVTRPKPSEKKITLEQILFDLIDDEKLAQMNQTTPPTTTRTYKFDQPALTKDQNHGLYAIMYDCVRELQFFYKQNKRFDIFFDEGYDYEEQLKIRKIVEKEKFQKSSDYCVDDKEIEEETKRRLEQKGLKYNPYYYTFYLPKKSGNGYRQIDAPNDELKNALANLKVMFEKMMGYNTYHTSAYAYIPKRSRVDLVKKLQANKSRWLLKLDFSNFFGSITLDWTMKQLALIYPFNKIMEIYGGEEALKNCLKLCFLDGKLPQGTPFSPLLTNILMIPLDYEINKMLLNHAQEITQFDKDNDTEKYQLIYTRYADDIIIGGHRGFKTEPVIQYIQKVLQDFDAPMTFKREKIRYGSIAGQNWILGLMYTQDYQITIGAKNKKAIKIQIHNFAKDYMNNQPIDPSNVLVTMGKISHLAQIEPEYADQLLMNCNEKYGFDVYGTMKKVAYAA